MGSCIGHNSRPTYTRKSFLSESALQELILGGLPTAFDLAAFRLFMIALVKKPVNHSRTVASMRETSWERQQREEVRLRSAAIRQCEVNSLLVPLVIAIFALTNFCPR